MRWTEALQIGNPLKTSVEIFFPCRRNARSEMGDFFLDCCVIFGSVFTETCAFTRPV
jgi:hypothetical protein